MVSVSRRAGAAQHGQGTDTQASRFASGEPPRPSKRRPVGSSTGSCSAGTGTTPQFSQWITGIGHPQ